MNVETISLAGFLICVYRGKSADAFVLYHNRIFHICQHIRLASAVDNTAYRFINADLVCQVCPEFVFNIIHLILLDIICMEPHTIINSFRRRVAVLDV